MIALGVFALVIALGEWGKRKHRTQKHRMRAWLRLINT